MRLLSHLRSSAACKGRKNMLAFGPKHGTLMARSVVRGNVVGSGILIQLSLSLEFRCRIVSE
jgi:hypothetical protein